jgi:fucose 4-O-acetylase-like acetyltransferase
MDKLELILPYIMTTVIFTIVTVILISLFNFILRKRIIKQGPIDAKALEFLKNLSGIGSEALKWGLILFFGGFGLVVLEFIPYQVDRSTLPYGLEAMFLAAGFLVYYLIMRKEQMKKP